MTEKLFTGTLNHNQNKSKQKLVLNGWVQKMRAEEEKKEREKEEKRKSEVKMGIKIVFLYVHRHVFFIIWAVVSYWICKEDCI